MFTGFFGKTTACLFLNGMILLPAQAEIRVDSALPPDMAATANGQPIGKHLVEVFLKIDMVAKKLRKTRFIVLRKVAACLFHHAL